MMEKPTLVARVADVAGVDRATVLRVIEAWYLLALPDPEP